MTQHQLECAVAVATGESRRTIHALGFGPLHERLGDLEPEDLVLAVDCPFCGRRTTLRADGRTLPVMGECDPCDVYFAYHAIEVYAASISDRVLAASAVA